MIICWLSPLFEENEKIPDVGGLFSTNMKLKKSMKEKADFK